MNYWPGFVDALSTMLLVDHFSAPRCSCWPSSSCRARYRARTKRSIGQSARSRNSTICWRSSRPGKGGADESKISRQLRGPISARARAEAGTQGRLASRGDDAAHSQASASRPSRSTQRRRIGAGAGAGGRAQPADPRRCASNSRRSRTRSTPPRSREQGIADAIADLGQRLNVALAQRVQELSRYRSDFFGRLRPSWAPPRRPHRGRPLRVPILGALRRRPGRPQPEAGPNRLSSRPRWSTRRQIPHDIPWILRVDGHTDDRPIAARLQSNWELSAARAIAVVQYLISKGCRRSVWPPPASANSSRSTPSDRGSP